MNEPMPQTPEALAAFCANARPLLAEALELFRVDPAVYGHVEDDEEQLLWALRVKALLASPNGKIDERAVREDTAERLRAYWGVGDAELRARGILD